MSNVNGVVQRDDVIGNGSWDVNQNSTCGQLAIKDDTSDKTVIYVHLSRQFVVNGERVRKGELIGEVGNARGNCTSTGSHLHFEVRPGSKTGAAAPSESLASIQRDTVDPTSILSASEKNIYYRDFSEVNCSGCGISPIKTHTFSATEITAYNYNSSQNLFYSGLYPNNYSVIKVLSEDAPSSMLVNISGLSCNFSNLTISLNAWKIGAYSLREVPYPYPGNSVIYQFVDSSGRNGYISVCTSAATSDRGKTLTVELKNKSGADGGRVIVKGSAKVN